jgi:hypothetical protein
LRIIREAKWAGRGSVEIRVGNVTLMQEEEKQFQVYIPGAIGSRAGSLLADSI